MSSAKILLRYLGREQPLTIRELYNLGISEVRKLYLHIDEVFGKAATNNEKLCVMNLAFLLIFLIFF